jgi:hypothetical protein
MANQRGALRKDDRVDVLTNAVRYWLDYMALDSSTAEAKEARKANIEFARQVMATQIGRDARFHPDPIRGTRGAGRNLRPKPTPGNLRRALKSARTATWR